MTKWLGVGVHGRVSSGFDGGGVRHRRLVDRSGGEWRPSAGSVYPTLQQLADEGLVRDRELDGRRVYELTDEPWGVRRFFVEDPGGTIVNVLAHAR